MLPDSQSSCEVASIVPTSALIVARAANLAITRGDEFARQATNQHVKHVRLRPHVVQQVRRNDSIVQCDSCQRILYVVAPAEGAPAAAS